MKKMKKLLSILVAATMTLAMAATSFADAPAENQKGTITINNAIKGQTYSAYKMFDLESYKPEQNIYSYKVVEGWEGFLKNDPYKNYFTIDGNGYLAGEVKMTADKAAQFAKDALTYANNNSSKIFVSAEATASPITEGATTYRAIFSNVDLGYYLIDSSAGTVCALNTTDPSITINEKNIAPTLEKTADVSTVTIGQAVNYTITIAAKPGAENYVAYDIMSAGLTFNPKSLEVKKGNDLESATLVESSKNYELKQTDIIEGHTFEVHFTKDFCDSITTPTNIYITYSATVNENAITINEITNEAGLTYGSNNGAVTTPSTVKVYTYSFNLNKTNTSDETIQGATFKLYRRNNTEVEGEYTYTRINVVKLKNGNYRADGELTGEDDNDKTGLITAGSVNIDGLGNGDYVLEEVTPPLGYNKLVGYTDAITINNADNTTALQVINNTGAQLPATGGIGTTIFYAAGIILMAGAVFFVVRRKKA